MATFPRLRTGAVTQYPSSIRLSGSTRVLRYVDGSEQRYLQTATPMRSWTLRLNQVSEEELAAIEEFFVAQQGQFGQFTFIDPVDGAEFPNCSFESDSLHSQLFGEDQASGTIEIRSNASQ